MIRSKTLFIIGAGAGFDIGMPLGEKLSREIGEKINIKFKLGGYEQESGDYEIMEALRAIASHEKINVNEYLQAGWKVADGVVFSRSIDSYLNAHSGNDKIKVCAKLGIVKAILEAERDSAVFIDHRNSILEFKDKAKVLNSWLQPFMFVLQNGVRRDSGLDDIFQNTKIINFNYDRCVEQFLWLALQKLFAISTDDAAYLLNKLPIIHPYGTVGSLSWQAGLRVGFGEKIQTRTLIEASNQIRTFNEQIEDEQILSQMSEWVSEAKRIVFLGFHFHDQNMALLQSTEPARGGVVEVYATGFERSVSELTIIDSEIRKLLASRGGGWNVNIDRRWDCSGLFKEFGTAIGR
ncbi:SIR2 family protein [Afipia broomeae]|uniref:Uncharacterized protein n=1 Tax=Afipia broomeae ATCC 49717 TaxID=883078 RepID=K8P857_9BRAD|nr:SIR2 family protein [Afipia broomeae]EKS36969.1 hypothetical protein HMPREF9695_03387 [Afipia broomeae ATCC 49717]